MSALTYVTAGKIEVVESIMQHTGVAGEDLTAGIAGRINSSGNIVKANSATAATNDAIGIVTRTVKAGNPVTLITIGVVDGFDLSGLAFGDPVFVNDTTGALGTAAGSVSLNVGTVVSAHANDIGQSVHKVLRVNFPNPAAKA